MKKIRKLIYNYVFKRVVAWQEGRIEDQELTDALYTYCDTNLKEAKICGEHSRFGLGQRRSKETDGGEIDAYKV